MYFTSAKLKSAFSPAFPKIGDYEQLVNTLIEKYKTFLKFGFNYDTDKLGYSVQYTNNKI